MNAYTKDLVAEHGMMVGMERVREPAAKRNTATFVDYAKNVALFAAAPFIGLAYIVLFPFVGLAMLLWMASKAMMKSEKARGIALTAAAPAIGLVFVTVGPFVALGALAWTAAKAYTGT